MNLKKDLDLLRGNFKLIVLDIDGTLINSDHQLTDRTISAIQSAKKSGIKVTLATGRQNCSAITIARKIGINAPLISSDGSMIRDIYTGETELFPLSTDIAKGILETAKEYENFRVEVFFADNKFYAGKSYRNLLIKRFFKFPLPYSLSGCYNFLRDFVFIPVINMGNIQSTIGALKEPPAKVVIYGEVDELKEFKNAIAEKYDGAISMTSALVNCVDILNTGVSKARGIAHLAEELGIKQEEIIAVGDNINDIEMIQYAGLGVAMGNALDEVKDKADYVTASNDEDGLACFLEKLLSVRIDAEAGCTAKSKLCEIKA